MKIRSRGELVRFINRSVDTFSVPTTDEIQLFNSIIEKRDEHTERSRFYRIEWGEIMEGCEKYLWYNPKCAEVFLRHSDFSSRWLTKEEIRAEKVERERLESLYQLKDCPTKYVDKNIIGKTSYSELKQDYAGDGLGYVAFRTAKELSNDNTVLLFSIGREKEEVLEDFKPFTDIENEENLIVIDSFLIDEVFINKTICREIKNRSIDLVIIDSLKLDIQDNYDAVKSVHNTLEKIAMKCGCKILVNTEII